MEILNEQHEYITQKFPAYDRSKSHIIMEFWSYGAGNGSFIAKIYRKGKFRFDVEGGLVTNFKKIA